jgi:sulfite reductase alpha subunit-like flavoprotein
MSTKKTIQINPELFKMAGNKTKKNRERKELTLKPIVSPNNLKDKLLKRIKEHKTNELKNPDTTERISSNKDNTYTDEFYGAIDYLSGISKKQKQQKALHNTTLKTQSSLPITNNQYISLELPPELQETVRTNSPDVFKVNYKPDDIPYGCLKGGHKKTYREWKELTNINEQTHIADFVRPPTPPKKNVGILLEGATEIKTEPSVNQTLSREERLEQIKNKLKKLQDQETSTKMKDIENFNTMEKELKKSFAAGGETPLDDLPELDDNKSGMPDIEALIKQRNDQIEKDNPKKYLKKTVRRKFTLGKSDKLKRVAVLIKDRQTRKNIINTQKELKKTNITDVRKYLRQHGIIKVGTTCPPDILRKTFEAAVLTGEVTNTNKETLLHNFLNETPNNS